MYFLDHGHIYRCIVSMHCKNVFSNEIRIEFMLLRFSFSRFHFSVFSVFANLCFCFILHFPVLIFRSLCPPAEIAKIPTFSYNRLLLSFDQLVSFKIMFHFFTTWPPRVIGMIVLLGAGSASLDPELSAPPAHAYLLQVGAVDGAPGRLQLSARQHL